MRNLGFLKKRGRDDKDVTYLTDPSAQYIDAGSDLSDISNRNLPSPSEVKGQAHLLSMPFFQELDVEENRRAQQIAEIN